MEMPYLTTHKSYLAALEGWRGVVALSVVLFHFYMFFGNEQIVAWGYLGVDFFFVLSGFIIARQYEAAIALRTVTFTQFTIKRFARLWPLYLFSIALFLWVNKVFIIPSGNGNAVDFGIGPDFTWRILMQLTMLSNIGGMGQPWNGPAWSVSVEWIVNILFFVIAWHFRRIPILLIWLACFACTVYLMDRSPQSLHLQFAYQPLFNETIARGIAGFCLGMLVFRYHSLLPRLSFLALHGIEMVLVALLVALLTFHGEHILPFGVDYPLQLLVFPALILISLYKAGWIQKIFAFSPITFLGKISYSLYLLHLPLGYAYQFMPAFQLFSKPFFGIFFLMLLIALATLSYFFIEWPGRLIGRQLSIRFKYFRFRAWN